MKKLLSFLILFVLAVLILDASVDPLNWSVTINDGHVDGPFGTMLGAALTGSGLVIGAIVTVVVGAILAVVFAGVGVVVCCSLLLGAVITAIVLLPFTFPILIPVAVIWYLMMRDRRNRQPLPHGTAHGVAR